MYRIILSDLLDDGDRKKITNYLNSIIETEDLNLFKSSVSNDFIIMDFSNGFDKIVQFKYFLDHYGYCLEFMEI